MQLKNSLVPLHKNSEYGQRGNPSGAVNNFCLTLNIDPKKLNFSWAADVCILNRLHQAVIKQLKKSFL